VDCLPFSELPKELLDYDTIQESGERYKFPFKDSMVLVLTFQGNLLIPFTTIRRSWTKKFLWYKSHIGNIFDIVVHEGPKAEAVQEAMPV
jgi:hypothetical protein